MLMAKASSVFRTLANLSLPLEKVVYLVNNEIVEAKFKGMFVTAVFGKMNIANGEIDIINAGHESIMLFDDAKNFEFIKSDLPPIGIIKYPNETMVKKRKFNIKNKTFVVYTDGVTEGYLKNGKELGVEGVKEIILNIKEINPKNIITNIVDNLSFEQAKLRDDITCMCIKINE
jgi:serine phosphatase RsbU (regulator of sigma subunit)